MKPTPWIAIGVGWVAATLRSTTAHQIPLSAPSDDLQVSMAGNQQDDTVVVQSTTVIDILSSSPKHSTMLHLLQRSKLIPTLNLMDGVTLFAPTDDAWKTWAKQDHETRYSTELAGMIQNMMTEGESSLTSVVADNILFHLHELLLYHSLNYTLPVHGSAKQSHAISDGDSPDRWVANNISTETTLHFPGRKHPTRPPPGPPWAPDGGVGMLGGEGQKLRLLFDGPQRDGPFKVGVDSHGDGGVLVWTDWPNGNNKTTAKQKRFKSGRNGVVVAIDAVLEPPNCIGRQLEAHADWNTFTSLLSLPSPMVYSPDASSQLNLSSQHHLTVFAPSNKAFDDVFDELDKRYLWSEWGAEGRNKVLGAHLVVNASLDKTSRHDHMPSVGWRSAFAKFKGSVMGEFKSEQGSTEHTWLSCTTFTHFPSLPVPTLADIPLEAHVSSSGDLVINSTTIATPDILASNGVIHHTESLLLPPSFKLLNSPEKVMLSLNATRFVSLLRQTGLAENYTREGRDGQQRTFLVPTDQVLDGWSKWVSLPSTFSETSSQDPQTKLEAILRYHILPGRITPQDVQDGDLLESELALNHLKGGKQRLSVHIEGNRGGKDGKGTPRDMRFGSASVIAEPCRLPV